MLFGGVRVANQPDLENVRKLDLLAIPMIRKMQRYGFAVNRTRCLDLSSRLSAQMTALERDISSYIPPDRLHEFSDAVADIESELGDSTFNAASSDQIAKLVFDMLGIGSGKQLKRTAGGKISTGKGQLRELQFEHPVIRLVLDYRERAKLINTYCKAILNRSLLHPRSSCCPVCELSHTTDTWRIHTEFTTTRTETGRLSSKYPMNLQNIPQRTVLGAEIRSLFEASPGNKLVSVDWSQIELRMMAHLAVCKSMIEIYQQDKDLHEQTAIECFHLPGPEFVDKVSHRIPSKTANFLVQYGGAAPNLYTQLMMAFLNLISEGKLERVPGWLTVEWCEGFIRQWFEARPEVREYMELQAYRARRYGMVWDIFGRVRLVPEVKSYHTWIKAAGLRQCGNMSDQGSCAGMMRLVMGELDETLIGFRECGVWAWPLVSVHDQLIVEVEEDYAEPVADTMSTVFDSVLTDRSTGETVFRVPVRSEAEILDCWRKG